MRRLGYSLFKACDGCGGGGVERSQFFAVMGDNNTNILLPGTVYSKYRTRTLIFWIIARAYFSTSTSSTKSALNQPSNSQRQPFVGYASFGILRHGP